MFLFHVLGLQLRDSSVVSRARVTTVIASCPNRPLIYPRPLLSRVRVTTDIASCPNMPLIYARTAPLFSWLQYMHMGSRFLGLNKPIQLLSPARWKRVILRRSPCQDGRVVKGARLKPVSKGFRAVNCLGLLVSCWRRGFESHSWQMLIKPHFVHSTPSNNFRDHPDGYRSKKNNSLSPMIALPHQKVNSCCWSIWLAG